MVARVVDAMATIQASMDEIGKINGLIEGIAFQSSILSLNAGVEAARAGEHGRGFAVVAGEVQALAQRSKAAAGEIKKLIARSTAEVEVGSQLAAGTGASMEEIHAGVGELDAIINAIATASQEQSAGIGQISQAVVQLDAVTQQNAALVEEAATAAGALDEQAAKLRSTISVFRLDTIAGLTPEGGALPRARRPVPFRIG